MTDNCGATISGTKLIQMCCDTGVKLLWIASENNSQAYIKGFKADGKRLNLVMTMNRQGNKFSVFLEELLSRMNAGEAMLGAWVADTQSKTRMTQVKRLAGACIFAAGIPSCH